MRTRTHHRVAQLLRGLLRGGHRGRVALALHARGDGADELLALAEAGRVGGAAVAGGGAGDAGDEAVWTSKLAAMFHEEMTRIKGERRTRVVHPAFQERAAGERGGGDGSDDLKAHLVGGSVEEG